jgi:phage gpG-like protein
MREATMFLEAETKKRFLSETDPDGGAWARLSPSTLAKKKTSAILRETGVGVSSIASSSSAKQGRVYSAGADYMLFPQTGTGKMPQRKFLGISSADIDKITKIFEEHFK